MRRDARLATSASGTVPARPWAPLARSTETPPLSEAGGPATAPAGEPGPVENPFGVWRTEDDAVLLLVADQRLFLVPSSRLPTMVPPEGMRGIDWRRIVASNDLGPLFGLPPVGAAASRVFRAGPRLGVMLDAGADKEARVGMVYLDHIAGRMKELGITELRAVILIHRHDDHTNKLAAVVKRYGIAATNVIMPRAYFAQRHTKSFRKTVDALRTLFGAAWQPADLPLRPGSVSTDLLHGRYTLGEARFDFYADARALRLTKHTDAASLLTRASRKAEGNALVILGDLRGADLARFHQLMGADRWAELFSDVRLVDGFSHHRGKMDREDVPGIMRLLEATLLRNGRLGVTMQTDPGRHAEARADTLEFMLRIGMPVEETHAARAPAASGVLGSSGGAAVSGPASVSHKPIPSPLTEALGRIERLAMAQQVVTLWGAHIKEVHPNVDFSRELRLIEQSLAGLRGAVRGALEAALEVRVSGSRTPQGTRDYAAGARGSAFVAAVGRIPASTPAEKAIGRDVFEALGRMHGIPAREVRLRVLLYNALVNGVFSPEAFQYMLSQIDPVTRGALFRGRRGGPTDLATAWRRVRAQFGFQQAVGSGMHLPGASRMRSRRAQVGARGVAGLLVAIDLANLLGQAVQSYRVSQNMARSRNVAPFLRRIAFWRQLRGQPAEVAVDDGITGATYERDPARIDEGLANGDWDYLYIEHTDDRPALADVEVLQVVGTLAFNVRNYDEYATLFLDSGQDAVRFLNGQPWTHAKWEVRVAHFETSGDNRLVERWVELELLTAGMRALSAMLIANTQKLLDLVARGESAATDEEGVLEHPHGRPLYRARPRGDATEATVELRVPVPSSSRPSPVVLRHRVTWPARAELLVWEETPTHVRVTGANFSTYALLRGLPSERYMSVWTRTGSVALEYRKTCNEGGEGWLAKSDIERVR